MKSVLAQWFECKVSFDKIMENGIQKTVTEKYVVNADSHSEAEELITREMKPYISGEFEVKGIIPAAYKEVFFMNAGEKALANQTEDLMHAVKKGNKEEGRKVYDRKLEEYNFTDARWYKAKVAFIVIDESTEKEKRYIHTYLVQAASIHNAADNIDNVLGNGKIDYEITSIAEQPAILDVFEFRVVEKEGGEK